MSEEDNEEEILLERLRELWRRRQSRTQQQWNRALSFGDYISDRWEKARILGFGEGTSIYDSSIVIGNVKVGRQTWIGPFTILDGSGGGLEIGDFCSISAGVQIYTHDSVQRALSACTVPVEQAPTRVGSRCYLGPNVVVAKGVTIHDGCVIGANSLVLSDIPAGCKAFGVPCKVVGQACPEGP